MDHTDFLAFINKNRIILPLLELTKLFTFDYLGGLTGFRNLTIIKGKKYPTDAVGPILLINQQFTIQEGHLRVRLPQGEFSDCKRFPLSEQDLTWFILKVYDA